VELRLAGRTLALEGRVVDGRGEGLAGARVWLADPTPFGAEAGLPLAAEGLLAGLRSKDEVEAAGADLRDTPHSFWSWVETDADGRFRLEGLLDRAYTVRALDPETLAQVERAGARPGVALELELAREELLGRVAGRVLSEDGRPVAGARVRALRRAVSRPEPVSGREVSWDLSGAAVETDADGRFELARAPLDGLRLSVSGAGLRALVHAPRPDEDRERLELRVRSHAGRAHFQVELTGDPTRAERFALLAGDGAPATMLLRRAGAATGLREGPLEHGRSNVLSVEEGDYVLVLYRGEAEVARQRVALPAGGPTLLRP
jgi:hypothetical protein